MITEDLILHYPRSEPSSQDLYSAAPRFGVLSVVGTVDRFQGCEAVMVILSLAASSDLGVPRRFDFLLDRNGFHVSFARAKAN